MISVSAAHFKAITWCRAVCQARFMSTIAEHNTVAKSGSILRDDRALGTTPKRRSVLVLPCAAHPRAALSIDTFNVKRSACLYVPHT